MEKLQYYEAREWFWIRTGFWSLPAMIVSAMAGFVFAEGMIEPVSTRVWVAIASGIASVLFALLAGLITMQFPYMRAGWRSSCVLNGPPCAVIAGVICVIAGAIVMTSVKANPPNAAEHEAAYEAFFVMAENVTTVIGFAVGAAAFWGYLFGTWFAMRRDKYFVEHF